MKISYIPLLLFYFLFFTKIYAQNEQERQRIMATYNQEGLKKLSEFFRLQEFEEKKKAYAMAKKKGWQIFLTAKDGTISELQKLDIWGNPIYYSTQSNLNAAITTRANKLWTGGSLGLNLNGQGMIVGEWDGGPILSTHQEFGSRVTQRDGVAFTTANGNNEHATHVAGTLIASGVDANAKGMAHQADLWANEWNTDETEMTNQAALGLLISNHSYGYNSSFLSQYQFGFYDATARDWDLIANNAPYYLIVKAAGNDRGAGYNTGGVFGTTGYNLISGSATAKNNLVVAAVNDVISYTGPSSVTMSSFSSWGPTDDGRIKPDISGNGVGVYSCSSYGTTNYTTMSGTSMASPNVTGTLTLLQQHYKNLNGGTFMKSATLRALAIHTADEAGANPGPDYAFGWGLLNAETAVNLITNKGNTTIIDERTLNNTSTYTLNVEASASPLEVTICWNDPAGTPLGGTPLNDTSPMLVNDLDVRVSDGVTTYLPWRLDPANPSNAATQADNTVDNVEKIVISSPTPGATYTITVSHKGTLAASQEYSLIVSTIANTGDPIVEFVSATSNTTESSTSGTEDCRGYQDVNIPLKISKVPSSDVTVDFTLSGTAANNADYKLNSSTVTFPAGSAANQSLSLRVYDEQGIESLEDIIITINSVSVGATIGTSNTHTASITDNDAAPLAANAGGTLLSEDFEGAVAGWAELTAVAGNNNWRIGNQRVLNGANSAYVSSGAATGNYDINSASDRVLRSSLIDATAYPTNDLQVSFNFQCNGERSSGTNWDYGRLGYFTEAAPTTWIAIEGSAASSPYQGVTTTTARTVALPAALKGTRFYIAWRWTNDNNTGNQPAFVIDDIVVSALPAAGTSIETATYTAPVTAEQVYLGPNSTVYAYNPSNGKLIAKIENPTSHDYGCTQIYVDRAGTSALQFTTTPTSEYLTSKTIRVIPTNNNPAGNYNIRIYYTETEIAGWETATSQVRASAVINKTSGSISSATLGSSSTQSTGLTQGLFGTDFWIEGNFGNGFSGFGVGLPPTPTPSPLELLSFRAVPESDWVRLSWSTASELNIARYVVEKSYDGKEYFGIGELSSGKNIYQFYDTKPIRGSNYYRLRIEETDKRSVSYSNVEVIHWGIGTYLSVYPIPTDGVLNLEFRTFEGRALRYRVLSQLGVEVLQGELTLGTNESKKLALDLGHLSRGIYFLETVYGQTKLVRKIVLQ